MRDLILDRPVLEPGTGSTTALEPLIAEHDRWAAELRRLRREINEADASRLGVREADRLAGAVAMRAGKPLPSDGVAALEARIAALQADADRARIARQLVSDEIVAALRANGSAWGTEVAARIASEVNGRRADLASIRARSVRIAELEGLHRWLTTAGDGKPTPVLPEVIVRTQRGPWGIEEDALSLDAVLASLGRLDDERDAPEAAA